MNILFVIPSYKPAFIYGGPIQSVSALCEGLVNAGHDVTVYTTNANGRDDLNVETGKKYSVEGVSVYYFKRITGDNSNISPLLLWRLWRTVSSFDVVHVQSWWNGVAIPAVLICYFKRRRPFLSPRGSLTEYTLGYRNTKLKRCVHALGGRRLLRWSVIHVTSERERQDVSTLVGQGAIHAIPNILSLPDQLGPSPKEDKPFQLVYLGRIDPKKRIEFLLSVMSMKGEQVVRLVLVGDGEEKYIDRLKAMSREIGSIVEWLGPLYGNDKWRILRDSDLLLLPSYNENFGNVVVEAVSQGTAVLTSPGVGVSSWVEARKVGWVIGSDPLVWRKHIDSIIVDHRAELYRVREEGSAIVKADFGVKVLISQYEEMYQEVSKSQSMRR